MEKSPVSVYFLGSGQLAIPVLRALRESPKVALTGVGTQPDKPSGRRRRPQPTAIGRFAADGGMAVDKPVSVNSPSFLARVVECCPEIVVVVAFGQILGAELLQLPSHGCLNVHASLLPAYRGASPIAAAIRDGQAETGVSFMRMDRGLDTGPVYRAFALSLGARETAGELEARLGELAAARIEEILWQVVREGLSAKPQDDRNASYASRLDKSAGKLDWSRPAFELDRCIRAYQPWPRATVVLPVEGKGARRLQIVRAEALARPVGEAPGTVERVGREGFEIACGEGAIRVLELIPEGSRPMSAADFLRGNRLREGAQAMVS